MKSLQDYIYESSKNQTLSFTDFMDEVTKYLTDNGWTMVDNSDGEYVGEEDVANLKIRQFVIIQDDVKISYNFRTNDNNAGTDAFLQICGYFNDNKKLDFTKFAINTDTIGEKAVSDYLDTQQFFKKQLDNDEWISKYSDDIYVYECSEENVKGLEDLIDTLYKNHTDISE